MTNKKTDVLYIPGLSGVGDIVDEEIPLPNDRYNKHVWLYPQDPRLGLEDYSRLIKLYCEQHELQRPLVLANSFGAVVATHFAATYPDYPRAVVFMGGSTRYKLTPFLQILAPFYHLLPIISPLQLITRPTYRYIQGLVSKVHGLGGNVSEHFLTIPWRVYHKRIYLLRNTPFANLYTKIKVPFLFIIAQDDPVLPPDYIQQVADQLPHSTVVFVDKGHHFPHRDDPATVRKILERFISQLP